MFGLKISRTVQEESAISAPQQERLRASFNLGRLFKWRYPENGVLERARGFRRLGKAVKKAASVAGTICLSLASEGSLLAQMPPGPHPPLSRRDVTYSDGSKTRKGTIFERDGKYYLNFSLEGMLRLLRPGVDKNHFLAGPEDKPTEIMISQRGEVTVTKSPTGYPDLPPTDSPGVAPYIHPDRNPPRVHRGRFDRLRR